MQASQIPAKFTAVWGNAAGNGYIRTIPASSQINVTPGAASLADGFPPLCFTPVGSGGIPPAGQDFNGILNQITAWSRWQAAGALPQYDLAFAQAIGGYPMGAVVASSTPGKVWLSTSDNNQTNPDSGSSAGWIGLSPSAAKTPFNYQYVTSSTRTDASASGASVLVPVVTGLGFVKKSATSNLVIVSNFTSYAPVIPGQANGASTVRLIVSNGTSQDVALNSVFNTANGAPGGSGSNSPTFVLPGVPAGTMTFGLSYFRGDNLAWRTIFNPYPADFGTTGPNPYTSYFIYEFEPGS